MLRSSIDLGTNTCLLLIAETDPRTGEVTQIIEDHATVVRLGEKVDQDKRLAPQAIERTIACLKKYSERVKANHLNPVDTIAVATSQARDSKNKEEFFSKVLSETGFHFRTLSGDEEAFSTFRGGLLKGMNENTASVIDIGGGSTEIKSLRGGKSLDIGSVRFTERYLKSDPVTDDEFWACRKAIDEELEELKSWRENEPKNAELLAVAGTATTLASLFLELKNFDRAAIDECVLTRGDLHHMVENLKWRSTEEKQQLLGIEKGRADVILAGALILWRACEKLNFPKVRISTRGLRFGILALTK